MRRATRLGAKKGLAAILALLGLGLVIHGAWIPIKAQVAQVLLRVAWQRALVAEGSTEPVFRPWPWADTWPVARLRVPEHGIDQVVLEGDSGAVLAFGPGRSPLGEALGDGEPGSGRIGDVVIGGHRDTHFAFLRDLEQGDEVWLEGADGVEVRYRVTEGVVVDHRDTSVVGDGGRSSLLLVTCWPFEAVSVGGRLRYVVRAERVETPDQTKGTLWSRTA